MNKKIKEIIQESITSQALFLYDDALIAKIEECAVALIRCFKCGGKVLIFGNGGSAADSQHFAAELVGRFQKERRGLAAIALSTDTSVLTALGNDYSFDIIFKRQIEALAKKGDLAFAISTSGNAINVLHGVKEAKKRKLTTVGLTGKNAGRLAKIADIGIAAPASLTARIQEIHILILHILCEIVEEAFKRS